MTELSPWVRKLVAISLLVCSVALLWSVFILPLQKWSTSSVDRMDDVRFELRRAAQTLKTSKEVSAEKITAIEEQIAAQLVPGGNEAEATTHVQSLVDRLMKDQELALESIQAASPQPSGALTRLVLDVRANGPEQKIIHFLASVEQAQPVLVIERFVLRGTNSPVSDSPSADSQVALEATIAAYWRPNLTGGDR